MRAVALISGGKDSSFNMMHAIAEGHEIVALANLIPSESGKDELDSYMYQTVGHEAIHLYSEALKIPLFRRKIMGSPKSVDLNYVPNSEDEVEDLFVLLKDIKASINFDAVASGAILSNYQRIRVESVCARLGVTSLSYLWRRDQEELFNEMMSCQVEAVIIKTAALGLEPGKHLGKTLQEMSSTLHSLNSKYGSHVCGEGGEFETFTLDCPLFENKIIIDESEVVIHSDDYIAPVGYLKFKKMHLEPKHSFDRVSSLPIKTSQKWAVEYVANIENEKRNDGIIAMQPQIQWKSYACSGFKFSAAVSSHGKFVTISNLQGKTKSAITPERIEEVTLRILTQLEGILKKCSHTLQNVCYVQINVSDMCHYKHINKVYSQFFKCNPPARACIGCLGKLDEEDEKIVLQLYLISCKEQHKKTMHVQGISHWAPANIGPFSQCVSVGETLFVSGTIGLVPGSMELIEGGAKTQAALTLDHVQSITMAMANSGVRNLLQCICYLTKPEDISCGINAWKRATSAGEADLCKPLYLVVNELPRAALAEWQGIGYKPGDCDDVVNKSGHQGHNNLESNWNSVKVSGHQSNVYSFVTTVVASQPQETLDLDECMQCVQEILQLWLERHQLGVINIVQSSLFCAGDKVDLCSLLNAWTKVQNDCSKVDITPVKVHRIHHNNQFCAMALACFLSS